MGAQAEDTLGKQVGNFTKPLVGGERDGIVALWQGNLQRIACNDRRRRPACGLAGIGKAKSLYVTYPVRVRIVANGPEKNGIRNRAFRNGERDRSVNSAGLLTRESESLGGRVQRPERELASRFRGPECSRSNQRVWGPPAGSQKPQRKGQKRETPRPSALGVSR
jgi:hypothetical protein